MAEEANQNEPKEDAESAPEKSKTTDKASFWARFLTRRWIAIVVGVSIVIHGIGFLYYQWADETPPVALSPEVSLGEFRFEAESTEIGRITGAEFSLYIALLEHVDRAARDRLDAHRFRVQQGIEELLRQAHSGDFDDPNLGDLKRRLQEQVNETLGMRAIADVIITDLTLQYNDKHPGSVVDSAESVPWVEEPSG
jgi:flagellar basal body-associated protein FliL